MATKFSTKQDALSAIGRFSIPCANPIFIPPVVARFEKVESGWYIGFPLNIDKRLVDVSEYEAA